MEQSVAENSEETVPVKGSKDPSPLAGFIIFLALFGLTLLFAMGIVTALSLVLTHFL